MLRSSRPRLDPIIVFGVAVAAHFIYFFVSNGDFYYPDSFTYLAPARNLLRGLGFVSQNGLPETLRTPAYPLLLVLFGARTLPVIIFQHLLNAVLAVAIYLFVISLIQSRFAALSASLLFALDTPTIHYSNKVLTETVFAVLLYVLFLLALRRQKFVLTGFLTGLLVLVRPIALFYFVFLAAFFLYQRIPPKKVIAFIVCALILPTAWAARNWHHTGVFIISSIGDHNLLSYRAAGVLAIEDRGDFRADLDDEREGLTQDCDDEVQRKLHIPDSQELSDAVLSRYHSACAWRVIREHPAALVQLTIRGFLVNLFDSDWDALEEVSVIHPSLIEFTVGVIPVAVFVFAVVGLIGLWKRDRPLALLIVLTVIYFLGMAAGAEAEARFRIPVMPQLLIAAAVGAEMVKRSVSTTPHPVPLPQGEGGA